VFAPEIFADGLLDLYWRHDWRQSPERPFAAKASAVFVAEAAVSAPVTIAIFASQIGHIAVVQCSAIIVLRSHMIAIAGLVYCYTDIYEFKLVFSLYEQLLVLSRGLN